MMQVVTADFIKNKKVLLRYDIDVALREAQGKLFVGEDFKLKAGLETLKLCLENASKVIVIGHLGRPEGKVIPELSVEPIRSWFRNQGYKDQIDNGQLTILENLRFDPREEECSEEFAKELALKGDIYINEAFSAHNPAASTTIVPTLMPHAAGLHFVKEVETLLNVRNNPKKPFVAIMGGAKVKGKLPVITVLAQKADVVLVGGKLVSEIREQNINLPKNVLVGKLNEDGFDIAVETTEAWKSLITRAAMIVWNGPLGKFEDLPAGRQGPKYDQTKKVAEMILESGAEIVIGGGDSVAALDQYGLLEKAQKVGFVSVGGGAMLKLISDGTLPTIEVLK